MDRRKVLLVVAVVIAALGAGLVFVYAQGADERAAKNFQTVKVIVATQEIGAGETAEAAARDAKLLLKDVPLSDVVEGATDDGALFAGKVALTTIYPGEQLIAQKFGTADQVEGAQLLVLPSGDIAVQVQLTDFGKVGAFTQPGSRVVVFVSATSKAEVQVPVDENGNPVVEPDTTSFVPRASVLLPDVLVLAVGSTTTQVGQVDANGQPVEETPLTNLTLAVSQDEAEQVIGAASDPEITLWFGLRNDASKVKGTKNSSKNKPAGDGAS